MNDTTFPSMFPPPDPSQVAPAVAPSQNPPKISRQEFESILNELNRMKRDSSFSVHDMDAFMARRGFDRETWSALVENPPPEIPVTQELANVFPRAVIGLAGTLPDVTGEFMSLFHPTDDPVQEGLSDPVLGTKHLTRLY